MVNLTLLTPGRLSPEVCSVDFKNIHRHFVCLGKEDKKKIQTREKPLKTESFASRFCRHRSREDKKSWLLRKGKGKSVIWWNGPDRNKFSIWSHGYVSTYISEWRNSFPSDDRISENLLSNGPSSLRPRVLPWRNSMHLLPFLTLVYEE